MVDVDAAVERAYLAENAQNDIDNRSDDGEDVESPATSGSTVKNAAKEEEEEIQGERDDIQSRRRAILDKIALFEKRGAILPTDAHTLRFQVHDSTSGQWLAVEERLKQLAFSWNPYQDYDADERRKQEKANNANNAKQPNRPVPGTSKTVNKTMKKKKKDFYELLQLSDRNASGDEIKKQFRKLALQLHPDKQQQQQASAASSVSTATADADATPSGEPQNEEDTVQSSDVADSTEFARLRVAYETLSDPEQRAAYDAKLREMESGVSNLQSYVDGIHVKDQIALEASTDFASLEWMARVKHKMDVMDRIAEWAKLLQIRANELRFETGEPCIGAGCGKIVSMDRDLECYGSPRRRVYICLLHKYIHACDESCTSHYGDAELDQKVCKMRAYWLVQNWLFEMLQQQQIVAAHRARMLAEQEESKGETNDDETSGSSQYELVASEIHLGDALTTFSLAKMNECGAHQCRTRFQFLEDGIFVCRRHGTPHVCTFEQCERQELKNGKYICWVSGKVYGHKRDEAGTGVRTRRVLYTDSNGESSAIEMEVPVLLPLGTMTSYLLEGGPKSAVDRSSSLSPPPPAEKVWSYCEGEGDCDEEDEMVGSPSQPPHPRRAMTVASYKRAREDEMSPTRARIRRRLNEKVQQADASFYIYLHVPQAVANLPKVALELQEQMPITTVSRPRADHGGDNSNTTSSNNAGTGINDDQSSEPVVNNVLPIRVQPRHTLNYIKHWMEELTEQLISIWDQQIFWSDTLIGDEAKVMTLDEHGIHDGVALELRLHDDCPLLMGNWTGKQTGAGEYNTVQISKEAEEDLDDEQEEHEILIEAEENAFQTDRLERKRLKMEQGGAIHHTEVIEYQGTLPMLVGVIPERPHGQWEQLTAAAESSPIKVELLERTHKVEKDAVAMKQISASAVSVKREKK